MLQQSFNQSLPRFAVLLAAVLALPAQGAEESSWGYEGATGPDQWGELEAGFAACSEGIQQSPIDLQGGFLLADNDGLAINWRASAAEVVDNGHTIQVNMAPGSNIELEGREFSLLQFHFHLPSEHTANGMSIPMEVHFVHQAAEGDLAVIGVFMATGGGHDAIDRIWNAIPDSVGEAAAAGDFDPGVLLPDGFGYSRYAGSLTTPPCSEIVSWVVLDEMIDVSRGQVDAFAERYPMNARPVQALNRRLVLSSPEQ